MPRRRLVGLAGILVVWLPSIGCGTGRSSGGNSAGRHTSRGRRGTIRAERGIRARDPRTRRPIRSRRRFRGQLRVAPSEFTITADDPGVQLLVTRENSDGTTEDLTGAVRWTVTPPGLAAIEPGGYLRPLGPRKGDDLGRARRGRDHVPVREGPSSPGRNDPGISPRTSCRS